MTGLWKLVNTPKDARDQVKGANDLPVQRTFVPGLFMVVSILGTLLTTSH